MSYSTTSQKEDYRNYGSSNTYKGKKQSNTGMIVIIIIILFLFIFFFMKKKPAMKGGDLFLTDTQGFSATSE